MSAKLPFYSRCHISARRASRDFCYDCSPLRRAKLHFFFDRICLTRKKCGFSISFIIRKARTLRQIPHNFHENACRAQFKPLQFKIYRGLNYVRRGPKDARYSLIVHVAQFSTPPSSATSLKSIASIILFGNISFIFVIASSSLFPDTPNLGITIKLATSR